MRYGGETYVPELDEERLDGQGQRTFDFMKDEVWRWSSVISETMGEEWSSLNARLRDFRKKEFGSHIVNRRRVPGGNGLHEYQLIPNYSSRHPRNNPFLRKEAA